MPNYRKFYNFSSWWHGKSLLLWLSIFVFWFCGTIPEVKETNISNVEEIIFKKIPKVALLVKEYYPDQKRINPDAMMASILESLESRIPKLVISLPKSLKTALENAKALEGKQAETGSANIAGNDEQIIIDIGGVKKSFPYEKQRSIWGMVFSLREIFQFIVSEADRQGLTKANPNNKDEPIDLEKLEGPFINALLMPLDPHSNYLDAKYAKDLSLTTKGEFGGVGIVISIKNGSLVIISPIDGTPAFRAGAKANDKIIKIEDDSAINMDLNEAVEKLRGKPGTDVRITVLRSDDKVIEFKLKRAIIKVDSVAYSLLDEQVGYLKIKAFQGNTASDVKAAVLAMKKSSKGKFKGLILDLRGNPGGLLREAVEVSSLFLPAGEEVVSTVGARPESKQVEMATPGQIDPNLMVVVLVDGGSASASEIVAGALKYWQGIVVGEKTFGKGSVQMVFDFPSDKGGEPSALKLTIAEYFGPNNKSIQNIGVEPHIALVPVYIDKLEALKLFPTEGQREKDLQGHLTPERAAISEKPLMDIEYVIPSMNNEMPDYSKFNVAKLKNDFAVEVARKILKLSKGPTRNDLIESAKSIKVSLQSIENKKINDGLKKYGIDWSLGETNTKDGLVVTIGENKGAKAGDKMKIAIKVKNTSQETYFQVHGITHSKTDLFNGKEFLFGKIEPGKEIERQVVFDIPKDAVSRIDLLEVKLSDFRKKELGSLTAPLEIFGLKRPQFAHLAYISDIKGNGDGSVQQGEDVELVVWLKNVGQGKAFEPTILLKNESGSKVFLKNGRFVGKEMLPNKEVATKFAFRVKEPADNIDFEIQIFDGNMGDIYRDKISIPVKKFHRLPSVNKALSLKNKNADLFAIAKENSPKLATLNKEAHLLAIKELPDFYLVKVDNDLGGYVKKSEVIDSKKKGIKEKSVSLRYEIAYNRIPAKVNLRFQDASGYSSKESGKLIADIGNTNGLTALLLYVNGKKVLYKDIKNPSAIEKLEHLISLDPGVNYISLLVQQGKVFGQRENITVYYDQKQQLKSALRSADKRPIVSP